MQPARSILKLAVAVLGFMGLWGCAHVAGVRGVPRLVPCSSVSTPVVNWSDPSAESASAGPVFPDSELGDRWGDVSIDSQQGAWGLPGQTPDPAPWIEPSDRWPEAVEPEGGMGRADCGFAGPPRTTRVPRERLVGALDDLMADHGHYCCWPTLRRLALGVAGAAVLANTSLDADFQQWYQQDVRGRTGDALADVFRPLGMGEITISACGAAAIVGAWHDQSPGGSALADFGFRASRAYLVGVPPMIFMQYCLGGSRPDEHAHGSMWRPFADSNGVSGHAFTGAVPFITGAKMTDQPVLKGCLYFCSTLTAWSRVNDNRHYLSQAMLGWWMAYLACDAVDWTDNEKALACGHVRIGPLATPEFLGFGLAVRR